MRKQKITKSVGGLMAVIFLSVCNINNKKVNLANVCQSENLAVVEVKGFFRLPKYTSMTTPDLTSPQLLLVENENGTGGFIEIYGSETKFFNNKESVKVTGTVLKKERSCVLQIQKIETP